MSSLSLTPTSAGTLTLSPVAASTLTPYRTSVYNVMAYGAAGDGTTDDSTAVSSAQIAAAATSGAVYFPHGTFLIGALTLRSNVAYVGAGIGATTLKLKAGVNANWLTGSSLSDVLIADMTLDGNESNQTSGIAVNLTSPTRTSVRNVKINAYGGAIQFGTSPADCLIENVHVTAITSGTALRSDNRTVVTACSVVDTSASPLVWVGDNCRVTNNYLRVSSGTRAGVRQSGATGRCVISSNEFDWSAVTVGTVISTHYQAAFNRISDNWVRGGGAGIHVGGAGGGASAITASRNAVIGNTIEGCAGDGILVGTDASIDTGTDNTVSGNVVYNSTGVSGSVRGVGIETHLARTSLSGNTVQGCTGHGMHVSGRHSVVVGNVCSGNGQGINDCAAIKIAHRDVVCVGNACLDTGTAAFTGTGILVADAGVGSAMTDYVVVGNLVSDSRSGGSKTQTYGVRSALAGSITPDKVYLAHNYVSGNETIDVELAGSNNKRTDNVGVDAPVARHLTGTATWNPGDIADGAQTSTTVTVTDAALGDTATVGFSTAVPAGALLVGAVTATNTVTVTLFNKTGGNLDLASGTLRASVTKY